MRTKVKIKILTIILQIWFCFLIYLDLFHVDDSYNLLLSKCFPYIFDYIYQEVHYAIKLLLALFKTIQMHLFIPLFLYHGLD